ncbi:MAG: DUF362 domain-containing protein, partial [Desulfobacteraceae bacterium]
MSASKVFFADMRTSAKENLLDKLERLIGHLDLADIIPPRSLVALKLHFGEKGNTAFIRPILIRRIVETINAIGANPFLTDANTLYAGTRGNSVDHLRTAIENGFAFSVVNAPVIIADGLRGRSSTEVDVSGEMINIAHIASDIAAADALISIAHFKGHDLSGFGGAIKNIGMGCASRRGKMAQHADLAPQVKKKKCIGCGECAEHCAQSAITIQDEKAHIDPERCVGCGECILICPQKAINVNWNADVPRFQKKMAEYTLAVLKGKERRSACVNFLTQITPACDCNRHSDAAIVQDLGIMASLDPVAVDQASVDMINQEPALGHSCLTQGRSPGEDKFRAVYPNIDWGIQLSHAEKLGVGSRDYELISI